MQVETTFDEATQGNIDAWLNGAYDEQTKDQIRYLLRENPEEALNSFYTNLAFGTGGMRGLMGVGPNRMNIYTIMLATQGLANYIHRQAKPENGYSVLIGYDCRHHSREFAEASARVLAANGIKAYLFDHMRPTPLVSFGCRWKKCTAGIVITASHNPSQYNGFKVYWSDGGQIVSPHDKGIMREVEAVKGLEGIKRVETISHPLIETASLEFDRAYYNAVVRQQLYAKDNAEHGSVLKVVFTSLHGTSIYMLPDALSIAGFTNVAKVDEQCVPNGDFPTVDSPNPENPEALQQGIHTLKDVKGDILIATDPDADRMGIAVMHNGEVHLLNGNQIGCICIDLICKAYTANNLWPKKAAFIKTIGTTELFRAIAESYGRPCFDVHTGFKNIAKMIHQWEEGSNGYDFVFGSEESLGYLLGTAVRDKDAIQSAVLICEAALQAKLQGKTLVDVLNDIYRRHGVYFEKLMTIKFAEGKDGKEKIIEGMRKIRQHPPKTIAGTPVITYEDYLEGVCSMPQTDALLFRLEDGSKILLRPSGTEPTVKIYCGVVDKHPKEINAALRNCEDRVACLLRDFRDLAEYN